MLSTVAALLVTALLDAPASAADALKLPNRPGTVKLAVIGDTGTGSVAQYQVGRQMAAWHKRFPFSAVLMTGDNIYGSDGAAGFRKKFELPYKALLEAGVRFQASLGNHDNNTQRFYERFNMGGRRYYAFDVAPGGLGGRLGGGVRVFALDSNYMDKTQLDWLEKELADSRATWKICFFHHPLYSSGKHGSAQDLRANLEPLFVRYGVDVVFTGHDHFYERIKPQRGINHFVVGAGGSLRRGNIKRGPLTATGFDRDYSFLLLEIDGDRLHFQAVDRMGVSRDAGVLVDGASGNAAETAR